MKDHENKSESIKIRLTQTDFNAIQQIAQDRSSTVSKVIRDAIFNPKSDVYSSVRSELFKQKIYNLIQHTSMPKSSREKLIKELNNYDERRN